MILFIIHHLKLTFKNLRNMGLSQEDARDPCVLCKQRTKHHERYCMGSNMFACVKCVNTVSTLEANKKFAHNFGSMRIRQALHKGDYLSIRSITGKCVHAIILDELIRMNETDCVAKIQATLYKWS
jgi:hypothetical protein